MQLTAEQFKQIEGLLPCQRGNVRLGNLQVLNAILHVAANGCKPLDAGVEQLIEGYNAIH